MNLRTAFAAPWFAGRPGTRWAALTIFLLTVCAAMAVGTFSHKTQRWAGMATMVALGEGLVWGLWMSSTILLAIDARQLRLPGVQRSVVLGLVLYGAVAVIAPALILGLLAGHALATAAIMLLGCAGGLAWALLPRYLGTAVCFTPVLINALPPSIVLPRPADPDFIRYTLLAASALLPLLVWSWRRLMDASNPYDSGWNQPMAMHLRLAARSSGWNISTGFGGGLGGVDSTWQIRRRPDWMQLQADLGNVGPSCPLDTLRVALGGLFMPITVMARLRQLAFFIVPSLLFVVLLALQGNHRHGLPDVQVAWNDGGSVFLIWFGAFGNLMLAFLCIGQLWQLWQKSNAELPLLALLPGLGNRRQLKIDLLQAILQAPVCAQLLLLVLLLVLTTMLKLGIEATLFVLISQAGGMAFVAAFGLAIIGGRSLRSWATGTLAVAGCILINISLFVPLFGDPAAIELGRINALDLLVAGWLAFAVALWWLARRGWRGLMRRPHPFLAT